MARASIFLGLLLGQKLLALQDFEQFIETERRARLRALNGLRSVPHPGRVLLGSLCGYPF